jgi:hypothetical protein
MAIKIGKTDGKPRRLKGKVHTYPDGREVCNQFINSGRIVYRNRTLAMRSRQNELCCLCGKWMPEDETTFEHENGRTVGKRDDRILIGEKRINGAAHALCNVAKGSRKVEYVLQ